MDVQLPSMHLLYCCFECHKFQLSLQGPSTISSNSTTAAAAAAAAAG